MIQPQRSPVFRYGNLAKQLRRRWWSRKKTREQKVADSTRGFLFPDRNVISSVKFC